MQIILIQRWWGSVFVKIYFKHQNRRRRKRRSWPWQLQMPDAFPFPLQTWACGCSLRHTQAVSPFPLSFVRVSLPLWREAQGGSHTPYSQVLFEQLSDSDVQITQTWLLLQNQHTISHRYRGSQIPAAEIIINVIRGNKKGPRVRVKLPKSKISLQWTIHTNCLEKRSFHLCTHISHPLPKSVSERWRCKYRWELK